MGCGRSCECVLKWGAVSLVAVVLFIGGVRFWLSEKSYVFSGEELANITNSVYEEHKTRMKQPPPAVSLIYTLS